MENNQLNHHGILGMKWGVRRYQNRDGSLTAAGRKRRSDDSDDDRENSSSKSGKAKSSSTHSKPLSELTDAELRERISRLELEKRYRDLSNAEKQAKSTRGKDFMVRVLEKSGENLATQVVNHVGAKALNKVLGEKTQVKDKDTGEITEVIKDVIFANNKKKDK